MKVGSAQVRLTLSSSWSTLVSKCPGMHRDTVLIPRALCKLEFHPFYHNYNLNSIGFATMHSIVLNHNVIVKVR